MPTFMKLDDAFRDWYLERTGVLLDKDLVLPVLHALQGHPEAARLWEEHISAILEKVGFKNTTHEKNIYTGKFCGEKVLLVRQVDDFGNLGEALLRCSEKTLLQKFILFIVFFNIIFWKHFFRIVFSRFRTSAK